MDDNPIPADIADALARGQTIRAIKRLRDRSGLDLGRAKTQVEAWQRRLETGPGSAGAVPGDVMERDGLPAVALDALSQGRTIEAIALTRAQSPGVSLAEAKARVEAYPPRAAGPHGPKSPLARGDAVGGSRLWVVWLCLAVVVAVVGWWLS